jgi:hypothetical protein
MIIVIESNDWRLMGQESYLLNKKMVQKPYFIRDPKWDHDHCAFCSETIDETTINAFCTEDEYHWVCEECFEDFKEMFEWEFIRDK